MRIIYNNAGLTSKVLEKIASGTAENCRSRQPYCRLMPPPQGTSKNVHINLICQKLQLLAYISAADSMGLSSFKFLWWAPKDASFLQYSTYRPFNVIQGR